MYEECAKTARKWLELLEKRGQGIDDEELIDYIGESRMLSKSIEEYD